MANLLKLRLGVSDDPTAFQPSLNDCLEAMLKQADFLVTDMLGGLVAATAPNSARRIAGFQQPGLQVAVQKLHASSKDVIATYRSELTRLVYQGGGKELVHAEALRFEDLRLFEDSELDQSIEVARAQQEVSVAVDDTLPMLDALVSTLLGWRTIQPGLNPLRPDVFVRALQATLAAHVPESALRELLIAPAAGLLGANLRKLYRELAEWLRTSGIEPAVPIGGRVQKGSGASGTQVVDSVAKTLLTLDRLRKLLHGDFDAKTARKDFQHTMPASMSLLQEMKQVDALVQKLEKRPKAPPPPAPEDMLAARPEAPATEAPRLGTQLGAEVIRLMFENLTADKRLLPQFKLQLKLIEPALLKLGEDDSRFFSDRTHPARQFLDKVTQRSLGYSQENDPGWHRFMATVEDAVRWLDSKVVDADTFGELMDHLHGQWNDHDQSLRQRREDAARALLHAEQRNLLAQKLAAEFVEHIRDLEVPEFVGDFLRQSWAQVVAEAQLSCADGSDDPYGYRALVEDLVWSVQRATATRGRAKRLVHMIPELLARLREGLDRIEYPPELTVRFFNNLITIHQAAVNEGRDAVVQAAANAAEAEESAFSDSMMAAADELWLDQQEAEDSGYLDSEDLAPEKVASPEAVLEEPPAPARAHEMRTGTWVELKVKDEWIRAQLTWASPAGTLFMFTSQAGTAHSMSRRTMDRLQAQGSIKVVADRNVVDEALDQVAKTALQNSLDKPKD
ncbi:hypothetical protein GCM10027034_14730 [Ramlibacter solisilvae]|uniref:Thymidine phosphorylase n=1 Tax=Ramlibacter tataouinensis TaxID=94132 RepID=A0A127JWM1_9BURK|nr:DUF1631 family protein [Ramlibacter tataouinensis]AMO24311.1 hypothetical protein UC35_17505 [Ramlibacter tataouinensis]